MTKSIKRNYLYNLIYEVVILIIPFITTPYLSRVLGAAGIGIYSYIASIVSYFSLFAILGVSTYGQREVSFVQNDIKSRSIVFWNTKFFQFITGSISIFAYVLFSIFQNNSVLYLVFTFNLLAVIADVTWFFRGMEEFGRVILRNIFVKVLNVVFIFVFIKTPQDVYLYALSMCFFEFMANIVLWFYLPKFINWPEINKIRPFKNFTVILSLFIPTVAIQIYTMLDKTMIGIITKSDLENGYYEQAVKVSRMAVVFVTALGTVVIPRIGFLFSSGDHDQVKSFIYRSYRFAWFLGIPVCFGLIGISDNFVPWFYGDGFDKVAVLLKILSFLILAIGINNVTGMQYLIPTQRQNLFTKSVTIGAIINFTLNIGLIYAFKSVGAAFASVIAESAIAFVQFIYTRRDFSVVKVFILSKTYVASGLIMLLALRILDYFLLPSILNTFCMFAVGSFIYFALLLIMKDDFFIDNIITVKNFFIKKFF